MYEFFKSMQTKKSKADLLITSQITSPQSEEEELKFEFEMPEYVDFDNFELNISPINEDTSVPKEKVTIFQLSKHIKVFYQQSPLLIRKVETSNSAVLDKILRLKNDVNPVFKNKPKKNSKK